MFSVIAISVGSRSMLEAPKKPTTPVGPVEHVLRVLGLGERPAVAEHDHVRVDRDRGVAHGLDAARRTRRASARSARRSCPSSSGPCAGRARRRPPRSSPPPDSGSKTYGRGQQAERRGLADHLDLERVAHARSPRGSPGTCRRSARRSGSSARRRSPRRAPRAGSCGISRNGSVPHTPASTGVSRDDRQHLAAHLHARSRWRRRRASGPPASRGRPSGSGRSCR